MKNKDKALISWRSCNITQYLRNSKPHKRALSVSMLFVRGAYKSIQYVWIILII
jgi:hypothetical protein